jgi:spoIIIJ-associated protein
MEWVETTGKTVEDAKEAALDQLGVHEDDAEFEVMEEPRVGLFGRTRGEARVRARVRPTQPRAKAERGNRRRRRPDAPRRGEESASGEPGSEERAATDRPRPDGRTPSSGRRRSRGGRGGAGNSGRGTGVEGATRASSSRGDLNSDSDQEGSGMNDATVEEQAAIMRSFLEGLVEAFDLDATFAEDRVDEDTIELKVEGDNLGLLIGPKGQTLQSVQELARTVVQRQATGTHHGRVRIDIGGYRQRRKEALERFTREVASDVVTTGVAKALEPMHPADRKVVHDTVNELEGVATSSEGEEPRRRVVISPAPAEDS